MRLNKKLFVFLAIMNAFLISGVVVEWFYLASNQNTLIEKLSQTKTDEYTVEEIPNLDLTDQSEEDFVDFVTRPLFIKGRRPVAEPEPEATPATTATPAITKTENFMWEVAGMYSTRQKTIAVFRSLDKKLPKAENHRELTLGNELDGWKITAIDKDNVALKRGEETKQLPLRRPRIKNHSLPFIVKTVIPPKNQPENAPAPTANPTADENNQAVTTTTEPASAPEAINETSN